MINKMVVDCTRQTVTTIPLTTDEQATYDALQTATAAAMLIEQQAAADDATARATVSTLIQSCVGVSWANLSTAQRQALIVALLYKAGALDKSLTVQPLGQWLMR